MKIKPFLALSLILVATAVAQTTKPPIDDARIAQLKTRMRSFVEQGRTAGIISLLAYNDFVTLFGRVADRESHGRFESGLVAGDGNGFGLSSCAHYGRDVSPPIHRHVHARRRVANLLFR